MLIDFDEMSARVLLSHADLALVLTDFAASRRDLRGREEGIEHAYGAYREIVRFLETEQIKARDREALHARLGDVRERLAALGRQVA